MIRDCKFDVICGDCISVLKTLEDCSVNCCVTSPPYFGLRDYGTAEWVGGDPECNHFRDSKVSCNCSTGHRNQSDISGVGIGDGVYRTVCKKCGAVRVDKQIGLEETPQEYIDRLVSVFREVRRVLTEDGVLFINIGDSYNSSNSGTCTSSKQVTNKGSLCETTSKHLVSACKPKDLIGIPWMLAFALREDGWYLRQDIIWSKPNPMPESVKDRFTKSHEYVFMLTKSQRYYFNHAKSLEPANYDGRSSIIHAGSVKWDDSDIETNNSSNFRGHDRWKFYDGVAMRTKRDVWNIGVSNFKGKHFATFPLELARSCVVTGCPVGGVVLDPFSGSGTTGICAVSEGMNYIGVELNDKYVKLSLERYRDEVLNIKTPVASNGCSQSLVKFDFEV